LRRGALVALATVLLCPAAVWAGAVQRTSMQVILPQVMCVTCGIPLQYAVSPQADAERDYIQQLIDQGDTATQVKHALVAQYGPTVLALPQASGFNLAVYVVPAVVVVALLALLALLLPRWRRNRSAARMRRGSSSTSRATRSRGGGEPERPPQPQHHIESGALTPSSPMAIASVRCAASASAIRNDSVARGSAPTT
jgi:cytochrome c-type biogenesis protein CcmH